MDVGESHSMAHPRVFPLAAEERGESHHEASVRPVPAAAAARCIRCSSRERAECCDPADLVFGAAVDKPRAGERMKSQPATVSRDTKPAPAPFSFPTPPFFLF